MSVPQTKLILGSLKQGSNITFAEIADNLLILQEKV